MYQTGSPPAAVVSVILFILWVCVCECVITSIYVLQGEGYTPVLPHLLTLCTHTHTHDNAFKYTTEKVNSHR